LLLYQFKFLDHSFQFLES